MKIDWIKTSIICASIVLAGFFVVNMHKTGKKYDRFVQVKGLSEREVNADLTVWPINITLTANDLSALKINIDKQNDEVYNFFIAQGFEANELTKGSTNISDVRADPYNSNSRNSAFRYLAKSEFTVRTNDINKLQKHLLNRLI